MAGDREELYRAMFEVNTAIKLLIDPGTGTIVDANPAAAEFYGWSLDELRGKRVADINTLAAEEILAEMQLARTQRRMAFHFKHRRADGSVRDVEIYSGPVAIGGRELLYSIIHDITERRQLEEHVRRTQRLDAIGRLAAGVAHDFNNLLAVVQASARTADAQVGDGHAAHAALAEIRDAAERGAQLTRQLLAFARQQELAPVAIELAEALPAIVRLVQRGVGESIAVTTELAPELPPVRFDRGQLELAILNLAFNARDAMPGGGTIAFHAARDGAFVKLTIVDTGTGMDAETRSRAIEPFFTTKSADAGSGLGLATVYGLVTQSGGQLAIDSAPGEGTSVHVWLPIARTEHGVVVGPATVRSVLLVDDRGDVLDALANTLAELGIVTHTASSAAAALSRLGGLDGRVDVVLSDTAMPGRSGVQLARDVHARWPAVPVVLMSGHARPPVDPEIAAFLPKPFSPEQLLATLSGALRRVE